MKLIKFVSAISAGVALSCCISSLTIAKPQTVNAVSDATYTKYSKKFHKVIVTKKTAVYRIVRGKYGYLNRYVKAYTLMPGDVTTVRHRGIEWGWTVGKSYKYCTLKDSFSWFDEYLDTYYFDTNIFDNKMSESHKAYKLNNSQYRQLLKAGYNDYYISPKKLKYMKYLITKVWKIKPVKD
ncbi:MAG: hypothetical protein ACLUDD_05045 [Lactobacillus kalixensis]|uniref:hypothetical protein n=1 Tax=Lactobacillus kalixensis TaxID=227944 RepID=UPI003994982E